MKKNVYSRARHWQKVNHYKTTRIEAVYNQGIPYLQKMTLCIIRIDRINSFNPGDALSSPLQIEFTPIIQLLWSCLIRVDFICQCVRQVYTFSFVSRQKLCKSHH